MCVRLGEGLCGTGHRGVICDARYPWAVCPLRMTRTALLGEKANRVAEAGLFLFFSLLHPLFVLTFVLVLFVYYPFSRRLCSRTEVTISNMVGVYEAPLNQSIY